MKRRIVDLKKGDEFTYNKTNYRLDEDPSGDKPVYAINIVTKLKYLFTSLGIVEVNIRICDIVMFVKLSKKIGEQ